MSKLKALVIKMPFEKDLGNVIQVARAEGMKLFRKPEKIMVVDLVRRDYGYIVVVRNGDGCISEKVKENKSENR